MRLRSISARMDASHALPIKTSRMAAVAAITMRKTTSSLKKMRFFTLSSSRILRSLGSLEAVAGAANRFQVARIFGIGLDLFANAPDINIDRSRRYVSSVAPDRIQKMIAAEDASLVPGEVIEQAEFGRGGGNHSSTNRESHRRRVDFNVTHCHWTWRQRAFEAAQHGFHACD